MIESHKKFHDFYFLSFILTNTPARRKQLYFEHIFFFYK